MRLHIVLSYLFAALQAVLAAPPPEYSRVLVIVDNVDADIESSVLADPLAARGFDVQTLGLKDRPRLVKYGERAIDNVIIIPGKTKALGSSLRAGDILEFMKLGGNVVTLTTPKHSPAALREVGAQLGLEISGRGVEARNNFGHSPRFLHNVILPEIEGSSSLISGSSVAKINDSSPYTLGLIEAPYSAYAFNTGNEEEEELPPLSDAFGLGNELFVSAALQSLNGARFVWAGTPELLTNPASAEALTGWAFQERGNLRIANTTHKSLLSGAQQQIYKVEEPLQYCAQVELWVPEVSGWVTYPHISDVQFEFRMLDPYYRLQLGEDGCVDFVTPQQYGMFTFSVDYKRPGLTFLQDKQVVTIRHRANDEWDRSWTITNSWVYLSGISTTVIGFILFVAIYLGLPEPALTKKQENHTQDTKVETASNTTTNSGAKPSTKENPTTDAKRVRRRTRN